MSDLQETFKKLAQELNVTRSLHQLQPITLSICMVLVSHESAPAIGAHALMLAADSGLTYF